MSDRTRELECVIADLKQQVRDAEKERDALRAKIAEMEQQEPVGEIVAFGESLHEVSWNRGKLPPLGAKLYALPGAQTQPAQNAVAYLDLGVGGYMDIGTDLTDEELATLPKGRHMLGIIGTYGVDGYVPAQPTPSIPEGWKLVPIEPTEDMLRAMTDPFIAINGDNRKAFEIAYTAMLSAAPEIKP